MDVKSKALMDSETKLKMTQNDLDLAQSQVTNLELKTKQQLEKIRDLEQKVQNHKEQIFAGEKIRDQQQVEYESKMEMLKQKLLTRIGDDNPLSNRSADGSTSAASGEAM